MVLWNKVLSGFDTEDETVNFGARAVTESNGSIYETSTIATIQSDGEVAKNPKVLASIQYSKLCVAIDQSITIFNDESCQEITLSIGFDSLITCHCLSEDCRFLFVVVSNGSLYCLHLQSGGSLAFSKDVIEAADEFSDTIVNMYIEDGDDDCLDVILVSKMGCIYRITKFDAKNVESALFEEDEEKLDKLTKDIQCSQIYRDRKSGQVKSVGVGQLFGKRSVVMIGRGMSIWPNNRSCKLDALPYAYVKVQFFKSYSLLLCLRDDGALNVVCPRTLIGKKVWDDPICDFITVQDSSSDPAHILALMAPAKDSLTTFLLLISFPDFEVKFKLDVPKTTYLVNLVGCSVEDVIFLEGTSSTAETVETVRVKAIVESMPEYRLERLLRRGKYDEAEMFAKRFGLNMESIYCSKATLLMNQLGPWMQDVISTEKLNEFIDTLDKIENVEYVFKCCNNTVLLDYKQTRRLLQYAYERLIAEAEGPASEYISTHLSALSSTLLRLETFELIQRTKGNVKHCDSDNINEWVTFSKADLLQEFVNRLMLGELAIGALIWTRHLPVLSPRVNIEVVRNILAAIPEKATLSQFLPLLYHFVPSLLTIFPDALSEIVIWGYKKTKSLEKHQQSIWPQAGLDFAKGLMGLLNSEESQLCFHLQQQYINRNSPLQRLTALIQALSDLQQLRANHRIIVPIDAYMGEPMEVAHLLLNRVYVEGIPRFVGDFLQQYMLNHQLKNDHVLTLYIQKTLNNSKGWWFWEEAPWERRVASIISCIHNVQNRLQQTLETLTKAPVPWSPTMVALVEAATSINHPLVAAIRTESNSVATKLVLKKYGYQHMGLNMRLIAYVVQQNRSEMMDDIKVLTGANQSLRFRAYRMCTLHYLAEGNIERAMNVIDSLDDELAAYCCDNIIYTTCAQLELKDMDKNRASYVEASCRVEARLRDISSRQSNSALHSNDDIITASELKSLHRLHVDFGIRLTQLRNGTEEVLQNYVENLSSEIGSGSLPINIACKKVERVAELLRLPQGLAISLLLEKTRNVGILRYGFEKVKQSGNLSQEETPYINTMCLTAMFAAEKTDADETNIVRDLCVSSLSKCNDNDLPITLTYTTCTNLFARVIGHDDASRTKMENEIAHKTNWKIYTMYKDTAVCMRQTILPFLRDALQLFLFHSGSNNEKYNNEVAILTQEKVDELTKRLLDRVRKIQMAHHDYSLLQILSVLHNNCGSLFSVCQQTVLDTLLRKIISARSFDLQLGLSCLFMLSESVALKWLNNAYKSYQTDYVRLRSISELGYEYYSLTKNESLMHKFNYYRVRHHWVQRLSEYGISPKDILNTDTEGKQLVLERLMSSYEVGIVELLEEFCRDFEFDLEECFILYLQVLLKKWNPKLNVTTATTGKKEMKINEHDIVELNRRCRQVAERIEDKNAMRVHIATCWSQINFYHYEVYLTIMDLLEDKNEQRINHICFLQNYTRVGNKTSMEQEEWAQLCPDNRMLPPISEWRLPYLPKINQYKLITPELNLTTYENWLEVCPVLNLQVHIICSLAIKGAVAQAWGNIDTHRNSHEWSIYPKNSAMLKEIKKCIQYMSGPEALQYRTAALYHVVNYTPPGADQVAAAQECYACAQQWVQQANQPDEGLIQKVEHKYLQFTSKHILYTHGLGEDRYLQLVVYPNKLVRELYMDESIVLRGRGATQHRPDINSAVNALCKIFSLNIVKIRLDLLQEWLQPDVEVAKLNDSITETFVIPSSSNEYNSTNDDNLLRACYILEDGDKQRSANFLINIGFGKTAGDDHELGVRFRALQVLQSITDPATLKDLTKRDSHSIRQYMKSVQYLSELETLGLTYSEDGFENCSKLELAQALWRNHSYAPQALVLICKLCMDFDLQNYFLWEVTLKQMAKLLMIRELKKVLPVVGRMSHMLGCSGYISGWQVVISEPFRKADNPPSAEQLDECYTALSLLHACPAVSKLDLRDIMELCFHCRQPQLAAVLLPFLSKDDQNFLIQTIEERFDISKVVKDLKALSSGGIFTLSYSLRKLEELLQIDAA